MFSGAFDVTSKIFSCIKENADLCSVILGPYGDKEFTLKLLSIGREKVVEGYKQYFKDASVEDIQYYYSFVSAGCIGLLEEWIADDMTMDTEDLSKMAEGLMLNGIQFLKK